MAPIGSLAVRFSVAAICLSGARPRSNAPRGHTGHLPALNAANVFGAAKPAHLMSGSHRAISARHVEQNEMLPGQLRQDIIQAQANPQAVLRVNTL